MSTPRFTIQESPEMERFHTFLFEPGVFSTEEGVVDLIQVPKGYYCRPCSMETDVLGRLRIVLEIYKP